MASGQETLLGYFTKFIGNFEKRVGINRTAKTLGGYRNAYNGVVVDIAQGINITDCDRIVYIASCLKQTHLEDIIVIVALDRRCIAKLSAVILPCV